MRLFKNTMNRLKGLFQKVAGTAKEPNRTDAEPTDEPIEQPLGIPEGETTYPSGPPALPAVPVLSVFHQGTTYPSGSPSLPCNQEDADYSPLEANASPENYKVESLLRKQQPDFSEPLPTRNPYIIQIGFDFGTSYCKCVYRDLATQKAWVYQPENSVNTELPFLLPCALQIRDGRLRVAPFNAHYHDDGLPHVKIALAACARGDWDKEKEVLAPYRAICKGDNKKLQTFVSACAIYLLAGYLGDIRNNIRSKFKGFGKHPNDYVAVNLAIPVADAAEEHVEPLFKRVLYLALNKSDDLAGHPEISLNDLERVCMNMTSADQILGEDCCFVYPEVSANIQSFVRSPNARHGIYFFCDTGAATVDQSVFIFVSNPDGQDWLNYLYARLLFLGSSNIERRAMNEAGEKGFERLEYWRKNKEDGEYHLYLRNAKDSVGDELQTKTVTTLFRTKNQLPSQQQFLDIKALFGGGGHMSDPYEEFALAAFGDNNLKVPMGVDGLGVPAFRPDVAGVPIPSDLEIPGKAFLWYRRLTVAYGLSFYKDDLLAHKFPGKNAGNKTVGLPVREIPPSPSSEVC